MDYRPIDNKVGGYCENCANRAKCAKVCRSVEGYLNNKPSDRLYSDRHIRRKEIPYSPALLDEYIPLKAIERRKGRKRDTSPPKI